MSQKMIFPAIIGGDRRATKNKNKNTEPNPIPISNGIPISETISES